MLPATYASTNGQTYHVKIGVTDIGDNIFDSGVFISTLSLCGPGLVQPPAQFSAQLIDNTVTLTNESRYATSWHWDFGDQTTTEERNPGPHTYAGPGTYEVTLITENYCCSDTFSTTVEIGVSSTEEITLEGFDIFPNPVQDELNIQAEAGTSFEFEVRDISGRLLAKGAQQDNLTIHTGDWKRGLYLLTLRTDKGVYTKKLSLH
ncbi:MAG: T9SS type A sorting domain-containing protein [Saprospirales bacterium]|nr:T9SS type A sorting domain-containing protein [Saprospirales bacterium]